MMKMPVIIREQKGTSAIEFAIVLPLLIVLLFGIIEFSILLFDKAVITNASREGARAGMVFSEPRLDDAGIGGVVITYCQNYLITFGNTGTALSTTVARGGSGSTGDPLTVTIGYHYDFLVLPGFINALVGGIDLTARTVMRME
jgi:Flp pilus assembly protein TadG